MNGGSAGRRYLMRHNTLASDGFTIVETLIVLAVSMALFTSAVLLINGRQNITAFNQSSRSIQSEMEQIINEVGSGYYKSDGKTQCTEGAAVVNLTVSPGTQALGTNDPCIYIGKVVQFGVGTGADQGYNIYTVAGLRDAVDSTIDPNTTFVASKARLVARGASEGSNVANVVESRTLHYGLTLSQKYYSSVSRTSTVGFTSNLNNLSTTDNSQYVNTMVIRNVTIGSSAGQGVDAVNAFLRQPLAAGVLNPTDGAKICFNSGGTNQSALLTLGGGGRQGSVDMDVYAKTDCGA